MDRKGRKELSSDEVLNNDVRKRIIEAVSTHSYSISQLVDKLKINRGTLKHHLLILKKNKIISSQRLVDFPGKPVMFSLEINKEKVHKYMIELLTKLNKKPMTFEEFAISPNLYFGCEDYREKSRANAFILYSFPKLVKREISLSKEGEKFLKENSK